MAQNCTDVSFSPTKHSMFRMQNSQGNLFHSFAYCLLALCKIWAILLMDSVLYHYYLELANM